MSLKVRRWQAGPMRAEVTITPEGFTAPSVQETLNLDLNLGLNSASTFPLPASGGRGTRASLISTG